MASPDSKPAPTSCPCGFAHPETLGQKYFLFFDRERRWVHVSDALCELLQYSRDELLGITADKLYPPDLEWSPAYFRKLLEAGESTGVYVVRRKDGTTVGVYGRARELDDGCLLAIWEPILTTRQSS